MSFNDFRFLLFFAGVAVAYFALPKPLKRPMLLAASYAFYMSWEPWYGLLLFGVTLISYLAARGIDGDRSRARAFLWGGVAAHLAVLFVFKYSAFFVDAVTGLVALLGAGRRAPMFDVLLPVGISFYVFQSMSYMIDVYRRQVPCEPNFWSHALFISFFPQLVAGPIERASDLAPQMKADHRFDPGRLKEGLALIGSGLFKKVVLSANLTVLVRTAYDMPEVYGGLSLFLAAVMARYMIFCDIAGYTDIAIGCGRILGVKLSPNFARPFAARNIGEFWQRWHMTVSGWFRDYVFFSLAASPFTRLGAAGIVFTTFVLLGLWHGAAWNFIAWGAVNGLLMVAYQAARARKLLPPAPDWLKVAFTFIFLVSLPTVLSVSASLREAFFAYRQIFAGVSDWRTWLDVRWLFEGRNGFYFISSVVFAACLEAVQKIQQEEPFLARVRRWPLAARGGVYAAFGLAAWLTVSAMLAQRAASRQFIYFRF